MPLLGLTALLRTANSMLIAEVIINLLFISSFIVNGLKVLLLIHLLLCSIVFITVKVSFNPILHHIF